MKDHFPQNPMIFFGDNTPAERKTNENQERVKRVQFKRQIEDNLQKIEDSQPGQQAQPDQQKQQQMMETDQQKEEDD